MLYTKSATHLRSIRPHRANAVHLRRAHRSLPNGQTINPGILPTVHPTVKDGNGFKSLRLRQRGQPSLPMPPFMDPALVAAREKYRQPKPFVQDEPDVKDICDNINSDPYGKRSFLKTYQHWGQSISDDGLRILALALATPVRYCSVSRARLPTHFLQAVSTVWNIDENENQQMTNDPQKGNRRSRLKARLEVSSRQRHPANSSPRVKTYMLNRRDMLDNLSKRRRWAGLVSHRMVEHFARRAGRQASSVTIKNDWEWEEDAAEKVLANLRSSAMRKLERHVTEEPNYFVAVETADDIPGDTACLLMRNGEEGMLTSSQSTAKYDLRGLLGETLDETMPSLLKTAPSWAIRRHPQTAHVQMGFERIRAYMNANRVSMQ